MALIFDVKVVPASGKNRWILDKSGMLKCYVKAPAECGKANTELIKTLAHLLRIPQQGVVIIAGSTSRNKKIKIDIEISYERLLELCGIQQQLTVFKK